MSSDADLLRRWREGDTEAGEQLFDRHFREIHRFFRSKVASGAEDLAQQTFLACVEGRERIRDDHHFRGYLFGAARRILYSAYTGRGPKIDFAAQSAADLSPGVETANIARQDERLLLEALRRIPLDYQVALELRFWGQLRGPQLAEVLGVPEGTVRSRIRRGVIALREQIEQIEGGGEALASTRMKLDEWAEQLRAQQDAG